MRPGTRAVACVLLCSTTALGGQPFALESRGGPGVLSGPERWRVMYLGDNDSIGMVIEPSTGNGYDRWYSTGTQLLLRHQPNPSFAPWLPDGSRLLLSAGLMQNIYTPRNARIASVAELQGDRPYAGWLSGSVGAELVLARAPLAFLGHGRGYTHLGLDVAAGVTGPWSLAGPVQHDAHEAWRLLAGHQLPPMVGWGVAETEHALNGEATAFAETSLATAHLDTPGWLPWSGGHPQLQWLVGTRLAGGTMRGDAALTTTLALGWMGDASGPTAARFPLLGFLYARSELRGVGWNRTIDGRLLDGSTVAASAPVVVEVSGGAVLRVYGLEISWVHAYRTNEVSTLPGPLRTGQVLWHWTVAWVW